jgi:hypothetical protein
MKTLRLIVERENERLFYVRDVETGSALKLKKFLVDDLNVEDGGLLNTSIDTMITIDGKVDWDQGSIIAVTSMKDEIVADTNRERVLVEAGRYKLGDIYDGALIVGLGNAFTNASEKMQYLYFSVLQENKANERQANFTLNPTTSF